MFNYFLSELIRIRHNRLFQRAILIILMRFLFVITSFILRFSNKEILITNLFYGFEFMIFLFGLIGGIGIVLIVYGDDLSYKTLDKVVFASVPPIQFLITKIALHTLLVILSLGLLYALMLFTILLVSDWSAWSNYISFEYLHRDFIASGFKMIGYGVLSSIFTYLTKHNAFTVFTYMFGFYGLLTDMIWIFIINWFSYLQIDLYNITLSQIAVHYASDISLNIKLLLLVTGIYVLCSFLINLKILLSKK